MKTYNEPGKARKQCPNCKVYIHARVLECVCKHSFGERKTPVDNSTPSVFKEGGRGKKQCPNCKVYCGVRNRTCPSCNTSFEVAIKENKPTIEKTTSTKVEKVVSDDFIRLKKLASFFGYNGSRFVSAIGYPPDIEFIGDVGNYCNALIYEGINRDGFYTPEAIKHLYCSKHGTGNGYKDFCKDCDEFFDSIIKEL